MVKYHIANVKVVNLLKQLQQLQISGLISSTITYILVATGGKSGNILPAQRYHDERVPKFY